tara:strand:- start:4076 stop:8008 length:3933 start_codon:yes stop_codon:yes gene_type:complete
MRQAATGLVIWICGLLSLVAQQEEAAEFDKDSIAFRTALHYDPSLATPLSQLVELYRSAERGEELISIYEAHIAQYPADAGAKAVLIRILTALKNPEAEQLATQAIAAHPDQPFLHFLHYQVTGNLNSLSKAIDLETRADRKLKWIGTLLETAVEAEQRQLVLPHLATLRKSLDQDTEALFDLAEKLLRFEFHKPGLEIATELIQLNSNPEQNVDLQILAAKFESALDQQKEADHRLQQLLEKLAPDYWRRGDISKLRMQLLESDHDRDSMLDLAKRRHEAEPKNTEAAIAYAEILEGMGLRKKASRILFEASQRLPHVQTLEKKAIDLLEKLEDHQRILVLLRDRLVEYPDRSDLRVRLIQILYQQGDITKAEAELHLLLQDLPDSEKVDQLVSLARFLERHRLREHAADLLDRALHIAPNALTIRTDLADLYIQLEQLDRAQKLINAGVPPDIEVEDFVEYIDFLVSQNFLAEAEVALKARSDIEPDNLDLKMRLVAVLGKAGNYSEGERLHRESRALIDSRIKYQNWLEGGMVFFTEFDRSATFFEEEYSYYLGDAGENLDESEIDRFLVLCEVGKTHRQRERVAEVLRRQLDSDRLSTPLNRKVRTALVDTLGEDPNFSLEVESQLSELLQHDSPQADEYRLQLGLLYFRNQRPDLARQLLQQVDPRSVQKELLLDTAYPIFEELGMHDSAIAALDQLTKIKPSNLQYQEPLLNLLAGSRDEIRFRRTIAGLISNQSAFGVSDDSIQTLLQHLAHSYWRSISFALTAQDYPTVIDLLDRVEHEIPLTSHLLWPTWIRAYIFNQQSQTASRDEAIQRILDLANQEQLERIIFPDGLSISLHATQRLLKKSSVSTPPAPPDSQIIDPTSFRWGFETAPETVIVQIANAGSHIIVLDDRQSLYAIDITNGKLTWRRAASPFARSDSHPQFLNHPNARLRKRNGRFITTTSGRVFCNENGKVLCLESASGQILWEANLAKQPRQTTLASQSRLEMEVVGGRLLAFDPIQDSVTALHPESGKMLWETHLAQHPTQNPKSSETSGAAFGEHYSFFFGNHPAILDNRSGQALWRFETSELTRFPIPLRSTEQPSSRFPPTSNQTVNYVDQSRSTGFPALNSPSSLVPSLVEWYHRRCLDPLRHIAIFVEDRLLLQGPEEMAILAADFPIASQRLSIRGTFIGSAGSNAAFMDDHTIAILNTDTAGVFSIRLPEHRGPAAALLGDHSLALTNHTNTISWNPNTGNERSSTPTPGDLESYWKHHFAIESPPSANSPPPTTAPSVSVAIAARDLLVFQVGRRAIAALGDKNTPVVK